MSSLKPKVYLCSFLFMSVLAACSKASPSHPQDPPPAKTNIMPTVNLEEARKLAAHAVAHCSDPAQCSPAVGMLVGTTVNAAYQCTAFLLSDDIVATNSHCVPEDLKAAGSNCQDRIALVFPDLPSFPKEKAWCSQVITASQIHEEEGGVVRGEPLPDYAFLRLARRVNRPALKITHEGFKDGENYFVDAMNPFQGNGIPEGYLHKVSCHATYNSEVLQGPSSPEASIHALGDCQIIHGNSGSPVMNSNGDIPGIAFASPDTEQEINGFLQQGIPFFDHDPAPMALVTNYSCLSSPLEPAGMIPPGCGASLADATDPTKALWRKITSGLETELNATPAYNLDPSFQWTTAGLNGTAVNALGELSYDRQYKLFFAVPKCIADPQGLRSLARKTNLPAWAVLTGLNRYLQWDYRAIETAASFEQNLTLQYDPSAFARTGKLSTSVLIVADHGSHPPRRLYSADLLPCN